MDQITRSLLVHFEKLPEPRSQKNQKHRLLDVVVLSICGVLVGCDGPTSIARWAQEKQAWLKQFLSLPNGIPSRDCVRRILTLLKPEAFAECFRSWIADLPDMKTDEQEQIAIDGKKLCGSRDRATGLGPLELLGTWSTRRGISLAQVEVAEDSNEIPAIGRLLERVELQGNVVSIDAIGCQSLIVQRIVKQKGDYVIAVKKNQKRLYEAIHACFKNDSQPSVAKLGPYEYFEKKEKSRGRIEERFYTLVKVPQNFPPELRQKWSSVMAIGRAVRRTIRSDGSFTKEMRYYITSRYQSGVDFATTVRQHWHIENKLHWVLDVILREDDCRVRNRRMASNLGWLRRFALNLVRQHPKKDSLKGKMQRASWCDSFLMQVLTGKGT